MTLGLQSRRQPLEGEEGPPRAAEDLAKSDIELHRSHEGASVLARNVEALAAELADARRLIYQGQAREAAQRSAQALALMDALAAKAQVQVHAQELSFSIYKAAARIRRRPSPRLRLLDRLLGRLGVPGQTLLIAGSGLWRWSGGGVVGRLKDFKRIAAYARRKDAPGIQPPALVDQAWYLQAPGVAGSGLCPIAHYLLPGSDQGLAPHPVFSPEFYLQQCAALGVQVRGMSPLEHFIRWGAPKGLDPHPLFSIAWYVGQRPDIAAQGQNPLNHYLERGWREGVSPHPLFDSEWYLAQATPEAAAQPPLRHYLAEGWREGFTPHPLFDGAWYLARYPDVARAGAEPLSHYATSGAREGRDPGPWFDSEHYTALRGAALPPDVNPLVDYLVRGAWMVSEARPGFATAAYIAARPEAAAAGRTPLEHWARLAGPQA